MELRDIEIFLTLAEELHFGRTAQRLHVSVARVSQAIKKQERGVGAELFERTSRTVRLTPVGEQLRADLTPVFRGLRESVERARMAAQGKTGALRVGMIGANAYDLRPFWESFRRRYPQWGLKIRASPFIDPFAALRRSEIDVLVSWLPVEEPDLTVGPVIFTEHQVLLVSPEHRLAVRDSVSLETLGDHGVMDTKDDEGPEYWKDGFSPYYTESGRRIERVGPLIDSMDTIFTAVSTGEVVHNLGAHWARYNGRPDILYLPIDDFAGLRWALIWRSDAETEAIRGLAAVVREMGTLTL
ncbi:LysR family transcriptional regulator [Amycolatopsis sp. NPDC059021]|uniref:LysR family transcriptional regulator n=1 Tax=Amycolatopsis sp. NPDC059021 TaxID=3346704 RepID=UPI00366CBDFD